MPFVDLHCDTISRILSLRREGQSVSLGRGPGLDVDLDQLRRSGYLAQCFALFVDLHSQAVQKTSPWEEVQALAACWQRELEENRDVLHPLLRAEDLTRAQREGKLGALLTVEEGGVCQGSLKKLRQLHRLGVRLVTLTWNYENELGHPNGQAGGLTETGFAFVAEMERLHMLVDVSHLSDDGFWDLCRCAARPFLASHSSCRALYPHRRNLSDEMIRAMAQRGGLVGVNFYAGFLTGGSRTPTQAILDHLRHVINVGGLESAALGSDFDGIDTPLDLGTAGGLPQLVQAMERAGFTPREIEAVCWRNAWRFLQEGLP